MRLIPAQFAILIYLKCLSFLFSFRNGALHHRHQHTFITRTSLFDMKLNTFQQEQKQYQQQLGFYEELQLSNDDDKNHRRVYYYDLTSPSLLLLLTSESWMLQHPSTIMSTTVLNNTRNISSNVTSTNSEKYYLEYHTGWELQRNLLQSHLYRLEQQQEQQLEQSQVTTLPSSSSLLSYSSSFTPINSKWTSTRPMINNNDEDDTTRITNDGIDTILFVEHEPVYTLGTGSDESFIQKSSSSSTSTKGIQFPPIVRMDRGGEVTYHGPGQLTVYPIIDLRNYKQDIHWYVRALEEVVIRAINTVFDTYYNTSTNNNKNNEKHQRNRIVAKREDNITGVWVNEYKVAAVGIKCKRWITQHGFAINITPESMMYMDNIVPCGLIGRKVGYINQFLSDITNNNHGNEKEQDIVISVEQMTQYVIQAMEDVFQIQLVPAE